MMSQDSIPYTRVPKSSALLLDYLYHFDRVARFYGDNPTDLNPMRVRAQRLSELADHRREIANVLLRQNEALGCSPETLHNIEQLAQPGTVAVVTGQQAGFFSGPAFTLYKALTAIKLADGLKRMGLQAVPIFWLASEDHDLAEVAHTTILNDQDEPIELGDAGELPSPQTSVGYVRLSEGVVSTLDRLESLLPPGEPRERLLGDLRASYRPRETWHKAFGLFMTRIFTRWGVIMLDPLDAEIHRLSAPMYREVLARADELRRSLMERSQELVRAGYHAQVHIAANSTLVFVERDGSRRPLHHRDGEKGSGYFVREEENISLAKLQEEIYRSPLAFSPNVLLRPVVQDCLLPTLAYVAGPSELAYFGQAQVLYEALGRPMPAILPRAAFTLVDARCRRLLAKYHVTLEDVWQGEDHLIQRIGAAGVPEGWVERFEQNERELERMMECLRSDVATLDPTLLDAVRHAEEKIKFQMERLKSKMARAALERSELLRHHQEILQRCLMPRHGLQEREVAGVYFLGRVGYGLLDHLLEHVRLESFNHEVLDV